MNRPRFGTLVDKVGVRNLSLILAFGVLLVLFGTLRSDVFFSARNILNIGMGISIFNDTIRQMGIGRVLGIPFPIWILVATAIVFQLFLAKSVAGRNLYALGGNPIVARFSGININRYRVSIYVVSGVVAGIGGILLAARTGSRQLSWAVALCRAGKARLPARYWVLRLSACSTMV